MALPDSTIVQWTRGYPTDANIPLGTDIIGTNLDDQFRLIKSVVRDESVNKNWERWKGLYGALSFVDATHFTLTGNQLLAAGGPVDINRRVKCSLASSTVEGTITDADFNGTTTTVTVSVDNAGSLDNGLSEVQFGILDEALPGDIQRAGFSPYFAISSGTDTYIASLTPPLRAYPIGVPIVIKIINTNTISAPTLNIDGLGAKTIVKADGSALSAGSLAAGMMAVMIYDLGSDKFQFVDSLGGGGGGPTPGTTPIGSSGSVANLGGTWSKQFNNGGIGNAAGGGNTVLFQANFLANSFDANGKYFRLFATGTFVSDTNTKNVRVSVGGAVVTVRVLVQGPIGGAAWWSVTVYGERTSPTTMLVGYDGSGGNGVTFITVANLTTTQLNIALIGAAQNASAIKAHMYLLEFWN